MSHNRANQHFASLTQRQAQDAAKQAAHFAYKAAVESTQQRAKSQGYDIPSWTLKGNPYPLY